MNIRIFIFNFGMSQTFSHTIFNILWALMSTINMSVAICHLTSWEFLAFGKKNNTMFYNITDKLLHIDVK